MSTVRFAVDEKVLGRTSRLVYRAQDYAFDTEPRPSNCPYAAGVNDVELMVDDESRVVYVTGYCPHLGWKPMTLRPPASSRGSLFLNVEQELVPGQTVGVTARDSRWPVFVDPASGWVCLGAPEQRGHAVEFVTGCLAVLQDERLVALWLHPAHLSPEARKGMPS